MAPVRSRPPRGRGFITATVAVVLNREEDEDTVKITGRPRREFELHGTSGEQLSVVVAVNAVRRALQEPPHLATVRNLTIAAVWREASWHKVASYAA